MTKKKLFPEYHRKSSAENVEAAEEGNRPRRHSPSPFGQKLGRKNIICRWNSAASTYVNIKKTKKNSKIGVYLITSILIL